MDGRSYYRPASVTVSSCRCRLLASRCSLADARRFSFSRSRSRSRCCCCCCSLCVARRASLSRRSFSLRSALDSNSCQSPSRSLSLQGAVSATEKEWAMRESHVLDGSLGFGLLGGEVRVREDVGGAGTFVRVVVEHGGEEVKGGGCEATGGIDGQTLSNKT